MGVSPAWTWHAGDAVKLLLVVGTGYDHAADRGGWNGGETKPCIGVIGAGAAAISAFSGEGITGGITRIPGGAGAICAC